MSQVTVAGKAFNVKLVTHTAPHPACHGCFFDDADLCPLEEGNQACVALPYGGQFVPADESLTDSNP